MVNDSLSDMLTRIRNALAVKKDSLELPTTKLNEEVCKVLKARNFISDTKKFKDKDSSFKSLHIDLRYGESGLSAIESLKRISKPGARIYKGWGDLPRSRGGRGLVVVSTSRGVMDSLEARKKHLGGEVLCEIY